MPHLGEKLKAVRLGKNLNQSEMADFLGVSFRSYQDMEKTGKVKKAEVLESILKKTGLNAQNNAHDGHQTSPGFVPAEELITVLKEQNEFLRRTWEASLGAISIQAASILAHVSTALEKDDEREAGNDVKKLQQLQLNTGRRIAEKMGAGVQKNKTADS